MMLRYCKTCKLIQGLRVFHCKTCGLCVTRHDHHCPWLSKCIGSGNHRLFMTLITLTLFYCIYLNGILTYIMILQQGDKPTEPTFDFVMTILLLIVTSTFFIFTFILFTFQIRVITRNQTTSEYLLSEKGYRNPFDQGMRKNIAQYFCNIYGYKDLINLNESATTHLSNVMLTDYFKARQDIKMTEMVNTSSISTDKSEII
jgi:hypothetical protein